MDALKWGIVLALLGVSLNPVVDCAEDFTKSTFKHKIKINICLLVILLY